MTLIILIIVFLITVYSLIIWRNLYVSIPLHILMICIGFAVIYNSMAICSPIIPPSVILHGFTVIESKVYFLASSPPMLPTCYIKTLNTEEVQEWSDALTLSPSGIQLNQEGDDDNGEAVYHPEPWTGAAEKNP